MRISSEDINNETSNSIVENMMWLTKYHEHDPHAVVVREHHLDEL